MPSFVEFRADLEAKFGRAQSENMRKKWLGVQMSKNWGKVTLQDFDEFRVSFKLALADVLDATPEVARRVLCDKLPPFMRKWVVDLEAKRMKNKCVVELTMQDGLTPATVQATVKHWTGTTPSKVEVRGGGVYWLLFGDARLAQKLLELHGRIGGTSRVRIQVRIVEQHLTVDDVFYEVGLQMETQEKIAEFQKRANGQNYAVHETGASKKKDSRRDPSPQSRKGGGGTQHRHRCP